MQMSSSRVESPKSSSRQYIVKSKISENSFSRRLSNGILELDLSIDEYLKDETFDIMPKTDYTYSRSGSYSPKYLDKPYVSPNMSRRKLRGSVILTPEAKGQYSNTKIIITDTTSYDHIGSSYIENRLQENVNNSYNERKNQRLEATNYKSREQQNIDEYRDEVDHDGRLSNQSASSFRYSETSNGMVLRSGSHLHGVKAVIDSHTDKNRQYGIFPANSNKKSHQSNYLHSDITTSTVTTYSSSSDGDHVKRKLDYNDTVNTNIIEKGSYETSEKSQHIKDSTARSQHSSLTTTSSINHLYGLDSDEEYSDEEINDGYTVSSDISEWSSNVENETITESFFIIFTAISTFFTELAKSVTGTFLSLFSPLLYYINKWLWKSSSVKSSDYTTDSRSSGSRTSKSFLYTSYNKEKKRRSKSCCLCLPCLLFLLPLLLLWGLYDHERITSLTKTYFVPLLWIERNNTVIKEVSQFDTYNLNTRVEQIVLQLQKQSSPSLSKSDVELIIQGLLEKQLTALRLDLTEQINNVRSDQSVENTEHSAKLNSLEMLLATAELKATNLEQDLSQAKLYANIKGDEINTEALLKIEKLENQLKMMNADIGTLKHAQLNMMSSVQNCCRNDSFYSLTVRQQINDILAGIVGGSGGNDGSDNVSNMFMTWLHGNYISKEEFESKMLALANDITEKILALETTSQQVIIQSDSSNNIGGGLDGGGLSEIFVRSVVEESLLKFSADRTGMADYALESGGGSIISIRCSETYYHKTALVSVFGIPLWYSSNSPRTVIQPDVHPGECWAFKGTKGYLVIQLANAIIPSGFTLEHIPKALSPTGNIKSAPRDFTVYGLEREDSRIGSSLGNYTYKDDGVSVQYFPVQMVHPKVFNLIELRIVNNYGHLEYTCLYRFRVHGTPQKL